MNYGVCEFLGYTVKHEAVYEYRSYGHTYWTINGREVSTRPVIAFKG